MRINCRIFPDRNAIFGLIGTRHDLALGIMWETDNACIMKEIMVYNFRIEEPTHIVRIRKALYNIDQRAKGSRLSDAKAALKKMFPEQTQS